LCSQVLVQSLKVGCLKVNHTVMHSIPRIMEDETSGVAGFDKKDLRSRTQRCRTREQGVVVIRPRAVQPKRLVVPRNCSLQVGNGNSIVLSCTDGTLISESFSF
jgi:hypothetical protein